MSFLFEKTDRINYIRPNHRLNRKLKDLLRTFLYANQFILSDICAYVHDIQYAVAYILFLPGLTKTYFEIIFKLFLN